MKEVLDKNIRGLFGKVDEIADELKQTQEKLVKLQNEVASSNLFLNYLKTFFLIGMNEYFQKSFIMVKRILVILDIFV